MTVFLLGLLAHALSDFVFQGERTVTAKKRGKFLDFFSHAISVAIFTGLFLLPLYGLNPLWFALCVFFFHFVIDFLKYLVDKVLEKSKRGYKPLTFVFDQVLHILSLFIVADIFQYYKRPGFTTFLEQNPTTNTLLAIAIVYIFVVFGGSYFIRLLLDTLPDTEIQEQKNANKGKLIGLLERSLLLTLWITGNPSGVAIVLTAKSIARFKEFDDKDFAEYYLIGTLTSTLIAVLGGIILKLVM
ncbi:MAG: DUF3307 domain-containing protein [Thermotogota bacterium]